MIKEKFIKEAYPKGISINLHVYEAGKKSHIIHINGNQGKLVIGRKKDRPIRIDYPVVSGNHCELLITPHYVAVKDLQSLHGTFINGILLGSKEKGNDRYYKMKDGDILSLSRFLKIYVEMIKTDEVEQKICEKCGETYLTSTPEPEFCFSCRSEMKKEFEDVSFRKINAIPKLFEPKNVEQAVVMELEKLEQIQAVITLTC